MSYCRALRQFSSYIGHTADLATEDQVRNYYIHIVNQRILSASSLNVIHHAMKKFHSITVPKGLRSFIRSYPNECCHALFEASRESLPALASYSRLIGSPNLGFVAVLHTWGRDLNYHSPFELHRSKWRVELIGS